MIEITEPRHSASPARDYQSPMHDPSFLTVPLGTTRSAHMHHSQPSPHSHEDPAFRSLPHSAVSTPNTTTFSSNISMHDRESVAAFAQYSPRTQLFPITGDDEEHIATYHQAKPSLATLLAFIALSLSIFLVALDTVILPTALPTISISFHVPDSLYAWIGSSYLLANAASVPLWGKLSDVFGRKPILLTASVIFLGGSILCAVSVTAKMLVAGRTVQGLGGGGVVVLVHVCVSDLFPIRDRSFYLGTIGAVWAVASAMGPVLGGIFAEKLNWRWCFYINIPVISCSVVMLYFTLHLHDPRTSLLSGLASLDWLGTLDILGATVLLLVGLQVGGTTSYASPLVITLISIGSVAFLAFPFTQWWAGKRNGSPIMPLRIFKDISNLSALGVCACDALVFNSVAYFLPLYFQIVLGRSPSITGTYMLAIAVPLAIVSFMSGHIIEMTGRFLEVLQSGLLLMTVGVGLLISLNTEPSLGKIIGFLIIIGLGFGPNFGAPLIALQTRIRETDIATGTAAFGFVRMVSGAIGVTISQVTFQILMKPRQQTLIDNGVPEELAIELGGGQAISQLQTVANLESEQRSLVRNAFVDALRGAWILYTVVSALGLIISFGIKRSKLKREEPKSPTLETSSDNRKSFSHDMVIRPGN